MTTYQKGWGYGPWGETPWGAGMPVEFGIIAAQPIAENVVRIRFLKPIYFSGLFDQGDASYVNRYVIKPVDGTYGIEGDEVRPVTVVSVALASTDGYEVDVTVDRPFTSHGSRYSIFVNNVYSTDGDPIDPLGASIEFDGVYRQLVAPTPERAVSARDFSNPQSLSGVLDPLPVTTDDTILGTFPVDDQGDYAFDEGLASYKKRVFRRIFTQKGRFAHLPNYGSIIPESVKRLGQPGTRDAIAADLEEQIREEPETVDVSVTIELNSKGVMYARVRARCTFGSENFDVPLPTVGDF